MDENFVRGVFDNMKREMTTPRDLLNALNEKAEVKIVRDMNCLLEADQITSGERHGKIEDVFAKIAKFWTQYLGVVVDERQVCMMMALLKIARDSSNRTHDNLVDLAGYARCAERFEKK